MSQTPARNCTMCGAPLPPEQRFCSNCGTLQEIGPAKPTALNSGASNFYQAETANSVPPPPPVQGYTSYPPSSPSAPYGQAPYSAPQPIPPVANYGMPAQGQQAQPLPNYAMPIKDSSKGVLGQLGCGVIIVILLIMVACGGIGYFAFTRLQHLSSTVGTTNNTGSGSGGNNATTTQPPITTIPFDATHGTVTYASLKMTIVDVKQSTTFLDDSYASTNGVLRLDIKEEAPSKVGIFAYSQVARLILPDKTSVQPLNEQNPTAPTGGTARNNWLDFAVPTSVKADQVTLVLGTDAEQQIQIPLTGKADLSQFQDKSAPQNKQTLYHGLKWTITNAATSLSSSGQQAQKGMVYVLVTVSIDNPSSNYFTQYYGDYIRLKSGGTTSEPSTDTTVPLSFDAGSSGKTGVAIFQVPPGATYTFILLADTANNVSQASIDFQV